MTGSARKSARTLSLLFLVITVLLLLPLRPVPVIPRHRVPDGTTTMLVAAGAQYRGDPFRDFLLGGRYRRLWTQPISVPVLDLRRFDGGVRPTIEGGGRQTRTLHFTSAAGRHFVFRSVDKDLAHLTPLGFRRSLLGSIIQDQVSASFPAAALVAAPLQAAAGLPHPDPSLAILPDDSLLGLFRSGYAGMLGIIQENASDIRIPGPMSAVPGMRGTIETLALLASPRQRIDVHAFLTARLFDVFLNDWDRHEGQWRWAGHLEGADTVWLPIPVDRDQAFSSYEGLVDDIARLGIRKLPRFGPEPGLSALTVNSARLDRRLLGGLSGHTWDSTAAWLAARLTDSVIDDAVHRMPDPYWRLSGTALAATLKQRRDRLRSVAKQFYLLLPREAGAD